MSDSLSIKRVVVASNISGTVLTDYITPGYQCTKNDRNLASFFQSIAAIAKEFDNGELQLVSFGQNGFGSSSGSPLSGGPSNQQIEPGNLNLALFMENDIIAGILYTDEDDDVSPENREKINQLTRNIHTAFSNDHLEFYKTKEVHEELNNAFQNSEDLPPKIKDRFASFVNKIPGIINSTGKIPPNQKSESGQSASGSFSSDNDN
ncbi:hypothetical protein M9Y10_012969 [Tritrichomonas musculus]|uniref:Uncharacterized protein n=2 Tax=Tritrichomonas musculus TaxID=1915356 RepID=A0ABR2I5R6_9EUKA